MRFRPHCHRFSRCLFGCDAYLPLRLDLLPSGPPERAALLTLSIVRAFTGKPDILPSVDLCATVMGLVEPLSPERLDTAPAS